MSAKARKSAKAAKATRTERATDTPAPAPAVTVSPTEGETAAVGVAIRREWIALALLLFAATLVRFWAMRWPPFPYDMSTWIAWGERLWDVGPRGFYEEGYFANYTPGYMYVLWLIAAVKHTFFADADTGTYYFLHRLPALLCDLAITWVIYSQVKLAERRAGLVEGPADADGWPALPLFVAALFAFNPAVILNSAVWGQVDSTFTLAMLVSVVLLLRGRPEAAIVAYAVAFLLKPHAIVLAPVVALALIRWYPPLRIARGAALALGISLVALLPFYGLRVVQDFWGLLSSSTEGFEFTSMNLYNLWGIYGFWKPDEVSILGPVSARALGVVLYLLGLAYGIPLLWRHLRQGADRALTLFLFSAYFCLLPVIVLTLMRERYVYPVLPFLLLLAALCHIRDEQEHRSPSVDPPRFLMAPLLLYIALTALHTMNLYQVYEFYRYFETGGVPVTNHLYYRIANTARVWSALSVLCLTTYAVLMPHWLPRIGSRTADAGEQTPEPGAAAGPVTI